MMNDVHLTNEPFHIAYYNTRTKATYLNLKQLKAVAKNDDIFIQLLSHVLNHEFLHWLIHKEHGLIKSKQLDNLFREANALDVEECNNYILTNQLGGF